MSDYPLGAKYDPRAPYNKQTVKKGVLISVTLSKTVEVEVDEDIDPSMYDEVVQNTKEVLYINKLCKEGWNIDEFIAMEDF